MKVGRNDPCPCGSGLKYKKCCLNKKSNGAFEENDPTKRLIEWFTSFDKKDLLNKLSSLLLVPENIRNRVLLQIAIQFVAALETSGTEKVDIDVLAKRLDGEIHFTEYTHLEDPPDTLFTENFMFHGCNYLVDVGGFEEDAFLLEKLLKGAFLYSGNIQEID